MPSPQPAQTAVVSVPAGSWGAALPTDAVASPDPRQPMKRLSVPLSRNMTAEVVFLGGEVTPRELNALRRYLELWEGFLGDGTKDDGEPEEPLDA